MLHHEACRSRIGNTHGNLLGRGHHLLKGLRVGFYLPLILGLFLAGPQYRARAETIDELLGADLVVVCKPLFGALKFRPYSEGCQKWEKQLKVLTMGFGDCPCFTAQDLSATTWDTCQSFMDDTSRGARLDQNPATLDHYAFSFLLATGGQKCGFSNDPVIPNPGFSLIITEPEWRQCLQLIYDVAAAQALTCSTP